MLTQVESTSSLLTVILSADVLFVDYFECWAVTWAVVFLLSGKCDCSFEGCDVVFCIRPRAFRAILHAIKEPLEQCSSIRSAIPVSCLLAAASLHCRAAHFSIRFLTTLLTYQPTSSNKQHLKLSVTSPNPTVSCNLAVSLSLSSILLQVAVATSMSRSVCATYVTAAACQQYRSQVQQVICLKPSSVCKVL